MQKNLETFEKLEVPKLKKQPKKKPTFIKTTYKILEVSLLDSKA